MQKKLAIPMVIAVATETPRDELPQAVGAHVAEGHGRDDMMWLGFFSIDDTLRLARHRRAARLPSS